jgi:hypothetical protein
VSPSARAGLDALRIEADPLAFRFEQPLGPQPVLADMRPLGAVDSAIRAEIGARLRPQDVLVVSPEDPGPARAGLVTADASTSLDEIAEWTAERITVAADGAPLEDYVPTAQRVLDDAGRVLGEANFAATIEPDGMWLGTPGPPRAAHVVWHHAEPVPLPDGVHTADLPLWGTGRGAAAWSPGLDALDAVADGSLTIAVAFGGLTEPNMPVAVTVARLWRAVRPSGLFGMVFAYEEAQPVFQEIVDQVLDATAGRIALEHLGVLGLPATTPHVSLYGRRIG